VESETGEGGLIYTLAVVISSIPEIASSPLPKVFGGSEGLGPVIRTQ
jgi:hypothetical protein